MDIDFKELRQVGIYDYVTEHYWEMTKEQLKDFCLGASYASCDKDAIDALEEEYED